MNQIDLNEILIFTKVVQLESFSQAAKHLGMPNSTVSSKVSSLEKRLGSTLITRTTRRLKVTPAGQAFFQKCQSGLNEIQLAEDLIAASQSEPQGLLRITAPVDFGSSVLPGILSSYSIKYPKVSLEVILTDRRLDLLTEGIDLAIRAGDLEDSTLVGRRLGYSTFAPFASPKYLKLKGAPSHPKDLKDHDCLYFTPLGSESWKLTGSKGSLKVAAPAKMILNDIATIKNLIISGAGIAMLPTFFCNSEISSGKIVRVLPGWQTASAPVQFVYPAQKFVSTKLTAFIEMATEPIKKALGT